MLVEVDWVSVSMTDVRLLILVSRVPGYGRFEYLVLGLSCESHHVTLINFVGFNDDA